MKLKKLIPLKFKDTTPSELEPCLVPRGFRPESFHPENPHKFRPDLDGLVSNQTGPVVEVDESIYMLK